MAEPSPKTGALLFLAGAVVSTVGFILEHGARSGWFVFVAGWLTHTVTILQFDAGPAVMAFGLGWLVSGLHPLRKWYLYSVTTGLLVSTVSLAIANTSFIAESYITAAITLSLTWAVGPSFITAGVFAAIVVNRHAAKHGFKPSPNPHENSLDVVVLTALYIPLIHLAVTETFYIRYVLPALAAWLFWHLLADRLTVRLLERQVKNNVQLVAVEPPSPEETTLMNVVSRSYYPLAFGLGVTTTVSSILDLLNIQLFGGDPFAATAGAALASIIAIAAGSLYVGPVAWLFEDLGIRIFDKTRRIMKTPGIHSLADEMVEIYTFIFSPIGLTFAVADGDILLALILLGLMLHLLFTISMTATYLYIRFSAKTHIRNVLKNLSEKGLAVPYSPA
ncbi:MAG: hypothetical protein NZ581_03010 [Candidatus Caldarchaeum sp.]|nr:hypothetical protein [Candidatus Caldarchaeum sp.]MDW8435154.1 hypothetical protein [Candidatus Caldarchaeum sp.]